MWAAARAAAFMRGYAAASSSRASLKTDAAKTSGVGSRHIKRVDKLPITPKLRSNLIANNIKTLFDIQAQSFHPILRGDHFVGSSRTGSGKTVAYLLPLLLRMEEERWDGPWRVLIVTPTRDLCRQVGAVVLSLSGSMPRVGLAYQGHEGSVDDATIVVGTPQRVRHLLEQNPKRARNVKCVVVDEADGLLSRQYFPHVEKLLRPEIQTIMFSATLPPEIMTIIQRTIPDATIASIATKKNPITHLITRVPKDYGSRARVLVHILDAKVQAALAHCEDGYRMEGSVDSAGHDSDNGKRKCDVQVLVFTNHAEEAEMLATHPSLERFFSVRYLHGEMAQTQRDTVISSFLEGSIDMLISTDVAARGLDFQVPIVVSFRPSEDVTRYLHRAGRTGRGTKEGSSITLYDSSESALIKAMRRQYDFPFQNEDAPDEAGLHSRSLKHLINDVLRVREEKYEPIMQRCEQWVAEGKAEQILRGALAFLDGRTTSTSGAISKLSGRSGFLPLFAHDPDYVHLEDSQALTKWVKRLDSEPIGMVAKCKGGWVFDAKEDIIPKLLEKSEREAVPLRLVERMPRIVLETRRFRRAPWARVQQRTRAHGRRTRERIAQKIKSMQRKMEGGT